MNKELFFIQKHLGLEGSGEMDQMTTSALKNFLLSIGQQPVNEEQIKNIEPQYYSDIINEIEKRKPMPSFTYDYEEEWKEYKKAKEMKEDECKSPNITTDATETLSVLDAKKHFLDSDEYNDDNSKRGDYIFLHHTGGWDSPKKQIIGWNDDHRGKIGTHYVIGGQSIYNAFTHDGELYQAIPLDGWGYHLGSVNYAMHQKSISIELCNFGYLTERNGSHYTWAGQLVAKDQVATVDYRGFNAYHKYSPKQLEKMKTVILAAANCYNIDIRNSGVIKWLKTKDVEYAFDYHENAKNGLVKGLLFHSNVRKDKQDLSPQQDLIDMLMSI